MISEESLEDTIKTTVLETSGNHIPDKFINMLLGLRLDPGGREKISYKLFTNDG